MAPPSTDLVDTATATRMSWRAALRSFAIGAAAGASLVAAPLLGWVGIVTVLAPFPLAGVLLWVVLAASVAIAALGVQTAGRLRPADRRAVRIGYVVGAVALVLILASDASGAWRDSRAYFDHSLPDPYDTPYHLGGIAYPPPFAVAIAPLVALGWTAFVVVWTGSILFFVERMLGPTAIAIVLVPLVALDVANGNVNLLIAAALVYGFRWPELLAVGIVTKITPAVSLLWFAARREWRSLSRALVATVAVVLLSALLAPGLWGEWLATVTASSVPPGALGVGPLLPRLMLAGALTVWGARTDRPWVVPLGVFIAMPVIWPGTVSILIACVPLSRPPSAEGPRRRAVDWALAQAVR